MLETQAERLIERLKSACTFNRFDEPGVYAEYIRALARYDYDRMEEAIDLAIEDDSRNVPAISVLAKKYREVTEMPKDKKLIQNERYCAVCDDKGFVIMKEKRPEFTYGDKQIEYEYVLYCPFCVVGRAQAYDGQQCKDHKSPYRIPPLTEYFGDEGIAVMREANLKRRRENMDVKRPVEKAVQSIGKEIPDGWQYDTDDVPF